MNADETRLPRLAVLIDSLGFGGAQRMMVNLANRFAEKGHEVDLLTPRPEGDYRDDVSARVQLTTLRGGRMLPAIPQLVRYLRQRRPASLVSALPNANIAAVLAGRLARVGTRIVVTERNHLSTDARHASNWRKRLLPHAVRRVYPWADAVIGISDGVAGDLAALTGLPASRLVTVYNPVVTPAFAARVAEPAFHPWLADRSVPFLIASGRLVPQKDYPTLLRALRRVLDVRPCRLIILGQGAEHDRLVALAATLGIGDSVSFHGFIRNPLSLMREADLFVLSSAWEGFGNVLVEALYCGLPIVATDCPSGPAEILDHGRFGTLVPVGDDAALAAAILESLARPVDPVVLRQRAMEFSVERIADQYLERMLT